jgi:hypothetical protein
MRFPLVLAHGALGPYDELIMAGAAAIFLIMMGISWVKSRNSRPTFAQEPEEESPGEAKKLAANDEADRFRLD